MTCKPLEINPALTPYNSQRRSRDGTPTATACTSSSSLPVPAAGSSGSSFADAAANSDSAPPRSSRSPKPASRPLPTASWPGRAETSSEKRRVQGVPTFAAAAQRVLEQKRGGWRGLRQAQTWLRSLETYTFPRIGGRPVSEVNTADVLEILTPIWHAKAETARAVRQRIRAVLEWAIAIDLRNDNPCDRVLPVLGTQNDIVQHRLALRHKDVAAVVETVRASAAPAIKLAFESLVLTAARSGEVRLATWDEIDTADRVRTISAARMKPKREHRVPLAGGRWRFSTRRGRSARARGGWCFPCGAGNRYPHQRCPRCSSTIGSRPWRTASFQVSATGRQRRRITRGSAWSRTRSKRRMRGLTCSSVGGSWTMGRRRMGIRNIFNTNILRLLFRSLPLPRSQPDACGPETPSPVGSRSFDHGCCRRASAPRRFPTPAATWSSAYLTLSTEKTQTQALDPIRSSRYRPEQVERRTHYYKRHGTKICMRPLRSPPAMCSEGSPSAVAWRSPASSSRRSIARRRPTSSCI